MEVIATICCRAGSKRLPNKAMKEIGGMTLIGRAVYNAVSAKLFPVISTDMFATIESEGKSKDRYFYSGRYIPRPPELAIDTASKWDVFRHIVKEIPCDILVDLDIGCPLREPQDITACVEKLQAGDYDVVATAYEAERNPYFNMVTEEGRIICPSPEPIVNFQDAPKVYSLSPAVYVIRTEALWKYDHWSQARLGIHVIPRERAWDIDTPFDYEVAKFLMERKNK